MIKSIDKSHSKNDLIDIINTINVPIVFSHANNKRDIQDKLMELFESEQNIIFKPNVYKIETIKDLRIYVSNPNPKKILTVKDKQTIMLICKEIVKFCKNKYIISKTNYKTIRDLEDDMLYIIQFGDLPSVRRVCRLMNDNIQRSQLWKPIISPQVRKLLDDKEKSKKINPSSIIIKKGDYKISFD
tara:strand:+ start:2648 stop:3205 length:558 start_codon:yes stop_codon:yes gene_type:complete